jgi:hypothetical protein
MRQLNQMQCAASGEGSRSGNRMDVSVDGERGRCTSTEMPQHHDPMMSQHRLESPRYYDLRIRATQQAQRLCIHTASPSASLCAWQSRRRTVFHAQQRAVRTGITIFHGSWWAYQQDAQPCDLGGQQSRTSESTARFGDSSGPNHDARSTQSALQDAGARSHRRTKAPVWLGTSKLIAGNASQTRRLILASQW